MLVFLLSLTIAITALEPFPESDGTIQGVVVNGTHGKQPLEGVDVVLRAGADGALVPVAETKTDRYGKFTFEQVPLDPTLVYLPGANRDGVHYPGQRVRLDPSDRIAQESIVAFDAVSAPCPLVAKRHDIEVTIDEQVLKITETLLISNPTRMTYVGQSMGNGPPVTLLLSIPKCFDRVTFDNEFIGRRFLVVDHRPVTDMPWLPGDLELRFTYRVPLVECAGRFRRIVDVPSSDICVRVHEAGQRLVSCNLPRLDATGRALVFAAPGKRLARDFTIDLQIASMPFPWMQCARWGSVVVLAVLVGVTAAIPALRRRISHPRERDRRKQSSIRLRAA